MVLPERDVAFTTNVCAWNWNPLTLQSSIIQFQDDVISSNSKVLINVKMLKEEIIKFIVVGIAFLV